MKHGPKFFIGALALLYIAFLLWFGGSGQAMSEREVESRLARINELSGSDEESVSRIGLDDIRAFAAGDDGREFFMVNLIEYRDKALYPEELKLEMGDDPKSANNRYGRAVVPYLIRNGSFPIYTSNVRGRLIHPDGATDWDDVAIVRYRSRRDFLNMIEQIMESTSPVMVHKWASVERTQVFPTSAGPLLVSSNFVRMAVLALLAALAVTAICLTKLIRGLVLRRKEQ
ncbi:MAG: hypothetical protein AAGA92_02585 [Planctomycetota bacterium]